MGDYGSLFTLDVFDIMASHWLWLLASIPSTKSLIFIWAMLTTAMPATEDSLSPPPPASWHKYLRSPSTTSISPVLLVANYTSGNITNPDGLVGNGTTTLTRRDPSDEIPSIVLDFGQNYAGILNIDFAGAKAYPQSSKEMTSLPGITLAFSETLEFLTNRSDFTRSDNQAAGDKYTNGTDQIAVHRQPYTWTNRLGCQFPKSRKVCSDGFHGFRYLKITLQALSEDAPYTTGFGSVSIWSLSLTCSDYLSTAHTHTGWFECSDENLTKLWYDGVYTNDLATDIFRANDTDPRDAASPSLLDKVVLHDGAKRDRDPYVGDLAVSALTQYITHDNYAPARNVLADLADHQRADGWIPPASINNYTLALFDYPLWWVVCSNDLVMYTADFEYLDTYYPNLVKVLDVYYPNCTNPNGLLEKGLGDSAGYGDYAFLPRTGIITYYNALYIMALKRAAQLADIIKKPDDAERWRNRAAAIGPALVRENWDSSVGAFFDGGACPDDITTKCPVHAQDGNSLAILSGAVNNLTAKEAVGSSSISPEASILRYMSSALARPYGNAFYDSSILSPADNFDQRVYPFISYFELAARFGGESYYGSQTVVDSAYDELRRLYGWMANHDPFSTFWEGIGPGGSPYEGGYTSMAHGWSTGIVPLLLNYVVGVIPLTPGFQSHLVRPVIDGGGLTWAKAGLSTPWGGMVVTWKLVPSAGGSGLHLTVESPEGTTATVCMPVTDGDSEVKKNGVTVWTRNGTGTVDGVSLKGQRVEITVEGGSIHVFETA
ncbi:hypothetical protein VP1G_02922 [Cytospora mali]|uniref:Alpha-L-rhamnosidase A n=1 Tax=Cytospora mali TaxID=578113 RepID=A0A194UV23_CYTMA|nr:hypothetical protein VP1G_02922 [Valsa mali var. pyri (nom. inval.)]